MLHSKNFFRLLFFIGLTLSLVECRFGGKYVPPGTPTPEEWKTPDIPSTQPSAPSFPFWWDVFNDPLLSSLEAQAVCNSPNLASALEKVIEAREVALMDKAALYPQLTFEPLYNNMALLFKIFLPKNLSTLLPGLGPPFRVHQLQNTLPFNLSYEIDMWGRLQGIYESDLLNAEVEGENFTTSLLTLTGDVANNYFILRMLDSQIELLSRNIFLLREMVGFNQDRYRKGLGNEIAVLDAQENVTDALAALDDVIRQRTLQEHIIATLVGVPASVFNLDPKPLCEEPPNIPPGLPSEVLLRRPDVAAAERHIAAQHALIGVAIASFFPSMELTGTLGFFSPTYPDFMKWKSRLWSFGANAYESVFDGGRNCANLKLTYAQYREAIFEYQQQVLQAFKDVEDALTNLQWQQKEMSHYQDSLSLANRRVYLTERKYNVGYSSYLDLVSTQLTQLQAELNVMITLGKRFQSTIQLIKSLGGGWSNVVDNEVEICCLPETSSEEPGSAREGEDSD